MNDDSFFVPANENEHLRGKGEVEERGDETEFSTKRDSLESVSTKSSSDAVAEIPPFMKDLMQQMKQIKQMQQMQQNEIQTQAKEIKDLTEDNNTLKNRINELETSKISWGCNTRDIERAAAKKKIVDHILKECFKNITPERKKRVSTFFNELVQNID